MATYNLTQMQEAETVFGLFDYANDSTGGILIGLFLVAFYFVLLMMMKRYEFEKSLLVASWITFIVAIMFSYAGLLNLYFALIFLIITAFTSFYMVVFKR